jgi:hypothetical protein
MSPRAKPMKYSASWFPSSALGTLRSTTTSSYPVGTMARAPSMMSLGIGGEKTILVATKRSFRGPRVYGFGARIM